MYKLIQGIDVPKDPYSGSIPTLSIEHAEVHAGRSFEVSKSLTVANGATGSIQLTVPAIAAASVTVEMTNNNADLTYTAKTNGYRGNSISVTHVDPGENDEPLTISRSGDDITISLATGEAGAIESTAAEVAAAINSDPVISLVLAATADGTGEGVVEAKSKATLSGGVDGLQVHFKAASLSVTNGEMTAIFKEDASFAAAGESITPINRFRASSNKSQLVLKSSNATTVVDGSAKVDLFTTILGAASPGNQRISGESSQGEEIILAQGKNYLFQVLNSSGSSEKQSFTLEWYERVMDNFRGFN